MSADRLLNLLALITLIEMMVWIGLTASVSDFRQTVRNRRLLIRAILANYVIVPTITLGLLLVLVDNSMIAMGFLILAVCPGGPYGAACTAIARGNVGAAAGLMLVLAGLSPLLSPLLLQALAPVAAADAAVGFDAPAIAYTLLLGQILPLAAGLLVQHFRPGLAARLSPPAGAAAKLLNAAFLILVVALQVRVLASIRPSGFLGMAMLLLATLVAGWLAGGPDQTGRRTLALTTGVRNNGVAMVIATGTFPGTPAISAAVVYGLVGLAGTLLTATWWGHRAVVPSASVT